MKKRYPDLLKKYANMSGNKKVQIGLRLSERVRKLIKIGVLNVKTSTQKERDLYAF